VIPFSDQHIVENEREKPLSSHATVRLSCWHDDNEFRRIFMEIIGQWELIEWVTLASLMRDVGLAWIKRGVYECVRSYG